MEKYFQSQLQLVTIFCGICSEWCEIACASEWHHWIYGPWKREKKRRKKYIYVNAFWGKEWFRLAFNFRHSMVDSSTPLPWAEPGNPAWIYENFLYPVQTAITVTLCLIVLSKKSLSGLAISSYGSHHLIYLPFTEHDIYLILCGMSYVTDTDITNSSDAFLYIKGNSFWGGCLMVICRVQFQFPLQWNWMNLRQLEGAFKIHTLFFHQVL